MQIVQVQFMQLTLVASFLALARDLHKKRWRKIKIVTFALQEI